MDTEPITVAGAKKLQDELNDLINNKRQKVIQAIAEALSLIHISEPTRRRGI